MKRLLTIIFAIGMFSVSAHEENKEEKKKSVKTESSKQIKQEQEAKKNTFDPELDAIDDDLTPDEGKDDYR